MASDGDTVAKLAQLSGANLVCHLQTTNRMADYKVAAHVLGERERRAAETEACLQAKIDVLQMKCDLLAKEGAYSEGGKKTNIDSNKNEQPPSMGLISTGGSPIAPALVATSCASVPDMSPHLVEESNKGNIEMQNQLSHLHLNNLMNQLSFDAWMEESGGPFMSEQVPFSLVLPSSSKSASLLSKIETSLWESEENMVIRFMENVELCMGAICALYRQKKLMVESTCEERTKFTSLNESQAYRATQLAEFLLDGDINGPMKKNKEDLVNHDATGPKFIQEYAIQCSKQLFDIYRNKEDLYFC
uniref:OSJNBb0076A22.19 protein n=1 Tax=Oryza sativa subsp. japonica TaxID=39947 RepID=Q7XV67_ORYSJ|nr:OSJNBb0076A22.19 [Oryza sativa Japonica Group]